MPEWSIGPHSKCGERATVPRVRIPVFPLRKDVNLTIGLHPFLYERTLYAPTMFKKNKENDKGFP